jgi:hypothetical protein
VGVAAPASRHPRRTAVCPGCQDRLYVRLDGLLCKHRSSWTGDRCPGSETTPIPIDVPEYDLSPRGLHDAKALDRWGFLSVPLNTLLLMTRAEYREIAAPSLDFQGSIRRITNSRHWLWVLSMPIGQDPLEQELTIRGLLAAAHGVDVADWPMAMELRAE